MFSQVFETWCRAVEATVEAQQEVLQAWAKFWPAAPTRRTSFHEPSIKPGADTMSRVPGFSRAELAELKEALVAYEIAEGDWSKSR